MWLGAGFLRVTMGVVGKGTWGLNTALCCWGWRTCDGLKCRLGGMHSMFFVHFYERFSIMLWIEVELNWNWRYFSLSVHQWRGLSWFATRLELRLADWDSEAGGWAAQDHCALSGCGGSDWSWDWLRQLTLLYEGCRVRGELPQGWEASLQKTNTFGHKKTHRNKTFCLLWS